MLEIPSGFVQVCEELVADKSLIISAFVKTGISMPLRTVALVEFELAEHDCFTIITG